MEIGRKIRDLRIQHGLTQEELSERCELSKGFISMVENDLTSPSISTMHDLLEVFGMGISDFFTDIETKSTQRVVYTNDDYVVSENENFITNYLVTDAQVKELEPLRIELKPGCCSTEILPHEGDMFGYVLNGEIELYLNDETFIVAEGESFYYSKPKTTQYIKNRSKKCNANILWISTPPLF